LRSPTHSNLLFQRDVASKSLSWIKMKGKREGAPRRTLGPRSPISSKFLAKRNPRTPRGRAPLSAMLSKNRGWRHRLSDNRSATCNLGLLSDLIRCLDLAESRPGYTFVALKWFRDVALPGSASAWAQSDAVRSNVLREAIDRRIVVTGRIPNPKSPQFPVTTLKLNRLLPEVRTVLGRGDSMEEGFEPITIRGENLSATVLRERR